MTSKSHSKLYSRPGFLIRRLHQIHCALFLEETKEFNVTPVQYSLLSVLEEYGEMDQLTLALRLGLERTSVAEVIPRLEERSLLERRVNESDKRMKMVKISRKGKNLLKKMSDLAAKAHERTIEALDESDKAVFLDLMTKLVKENNEFGKAPFKS
ncbi:MarR family transcriptional regulator [Tatumella morbirosei]|uniref:MarR family transcriptional regulator n=1 Tax=Tatumella morbirosei TaxID=642227 RepID=A0A095TDR9_9GAMM|nr:MarR family transcriptional regulator [Tatumella morbirosei]KGD74857.1 MarR family transcriptional regulator [Tatumella morbirosei]